MSGESPGADDDVYAWLRAHYSDLGFKPQGLICPHILIPAAVMADEDEYALVQAVIDFVNWAFNQAGLIPGEFPVEALDSYFADYYVAQVKNGGHAQYISNSGWTDVTNRCATRGLTAMGASGYAAVNQDLLAFMAAAGEPLRQTLIEDFSPKAAPETEALDDRFFALDDKLYYAAHTQWLRALPSLRPLEPSDLETALAAVRQKNAEREGRHERARAANEESEAASALYRTAKALCHAVRTQFGGLTAGGLLPMRMVAPGLPDQNVFNWGVKTGRGVLFVFFHERYGWMGGPRAVMYERNNAAPLAWLKLSRAEYDEIVHPRWRGEK